VFERCFRTAAPLLAACKGMFEQKFLLGKSDIIAQLAVDGKPKPCAGTL
jgi:hypothetical protein